MRQSGAKYGKTMKHAPAGLLLLALLSFGLAACAVRTPVPLAQRAASALTPYQTQPPSPTPLAAVAAQGTTSPPPAASTTPQTYTIRAGDTLLEIAQRYGVSLDEMLAANPGIIPEALTVGQVIRIPALGSAPEQPAPPALTVGEEACYRSGGGMWCFAPVSNPAAQRVEHVVVQVTLFDAAGRPVTGQEALLPLEGLNAGESLPAAAFFGEVEAFEDVRAQVVAAIAVDQVRLLPLEMRGLLVSIGWGGGWAQVEGRIRLADGAPAASTVRLAAVAYDAAGRVTGLRGWQSEALAPGEERAFSFAVYRAGAPIARVEVLAEAQP